MMISEDKINKCKTESEKETARFFERLGLQCIDLNYTVTNQNKVNLGEVDGIFLDSENEFLIIYDVSTEKDANRKTISFLSRAQQPNFREIINTNYDNLPNFPFLIFYIDLARDNDTVLDSIEHVLDDNSFLLFKNDFEYFNSLSQLFYNWVKNDLYNYLNIKPQKPLFEEKDAYQIYIGNTPAYVFCDRPDNILKYSYICRRRGNDKGYQRMVDFERIKKIRNKIESAELLGFPNSILLNSTEKICVSPFPKEECPKLTKLYLPNSFSGCRIVDGQHRLLSFSLLNQNFQTKFNIPIVLMDNLDSDTEIKMFLDINNNTKRVDPSLIYSLTAEFSIEKSNENYLIKIAVSIISELEKDSPIKGKVYFGTIDSTSNKKDKITLKSFVDSIIRHKLIDLNGGFLQTKNEVDDMQNPVRYIKLFLIQVSKTAKDKSYFLSNRGIELICNLLAYIIYLNEETDIEILIDKYSKYIVEIVNNKVDELRKYQGQKGFQDAFQLIIQSLAQEIPTENNLTICKEDHSDIQNNIKGLETNLSDNELIKCVGCAFLEGIKDGQIGRKRDLAEIRKLLPYKRYSKRNKKNFDSAYELGFQSV